MLSSPNQTAPPDQVVPSRQPFGLWSYTESGDAIAWFLAVAETVVTAIAAAAATVVIAAATTRTRTRKQLQSSVIMAGG